MLIRIVFLGSPEFAVPPLQSLAADSRVDVALVVTQPDRPAGRGRRLRPPALKTAATALGIPVFQPESLRSDDAVDRLRSVQADLFVVVAYGEILRRAVLDLPPHGCLNVHPSLLPRYRGSSPIQAAILNGDAETGISIIKLVRRLDAGPIVSQASLRLDGTETAGSLSERLAALAAEVLPDVVVEWVAGRLTAVPQDEDAATYTGEISKDDGLIDWRQDAVRIERLVRAMNPWPTAWSVVGGRRLAVLKCDISDEHFNTPPGTISATASGILVSTGSGTIRLLEVQPEGRRVMPASAWYRGARLAPGARFENPPGQTRADDAEFSG